MYKIIVVPALLFLLVWLSDNLLCSGENVKPGISTLTKGTQSEESTAEKDMNTEDTETGEPISGNAQIADSALQSVAVAEQDAGKAVREDAEFKTEESTSTVAEKIVKQEDKTESVVESQNDVIAKVNEEAIIRKDFDRRLNVFRRMNQDVTRATKMQVVNQLVKKALLRQFVDKQEIGVGEEEIHEELEKIKLFLKNNPNNKGKTLEEILEIQGSSISELKEEVRRTLALSKFLEKSVTDTDKRNYFNENKDAFNGARVRASHILIDTRNMETDAERAEAEKMIKVVKMEIDKGADFAEMAKKYSDCPSAEKGGDIGFFQRKGSVVEDFAKVAFAMEVGEISEPVKTQFGYHIIKVTDKEEGKDVNYEDVSDMVDFVYMQMKTESLLKELYDKAEIKIMI